jgi:hypothetical protein
MPNEKKLKFFSGGLQKLLIEGMGGPSGQDIQPL